MMWVSPPTSFGGGAGGIERAVGGLGRGFVEARMYPTGCNKQLIAPFSFLSVFQLCESRAAEMKKALPWSHALSGRATQSGESVLWLFGCVCDFFNRYHPILQMCLKIKACKKHMHRMLWYHYQAVEQDPL